MSTLVWLVASYDNPSQNRKTGVLPEEQKRTPLPSASPFSTADSAPCPGTVLPARSCRTSRAARTVRPTCLTSDISMLTLIQMEREAPPKPIGSPDQGTNETTASWTTVHPRNLPRRSGTLQNDKSYLRASYLSAVSWSFPVREKTTKNNRQVHISPLAPVRVSLSIGGTPRLVVFLCQAKRESTRKAGVPVSSTPTFFLVGESKNRLSGWGKKKKKG